MSEKEEIISINNQHINEAKNNQINEEVINTNNKSLNKDQNKQIKKENIIKSNNELIGEIQNNQINIFKENIINKSISNVKNNQINLSGENNINIISRSINESKNNSISFNIINSQSSSLKLINNTKSKYDSSELSLNKYELLKNESALHLALTDIKKYIQKDKIMQLKFRFIKKKLGLDEFEKMSGTSFEEFVRNCFKIMLMMINQNNINFFFLKTRKKLNCMI